MKYEGVVCPICNSAFDENSDVVVCPECGTPFHRDCYNEIGHCMYELKHGDYVWENPNKPVEDKKIEEKKIDVIPLSKEAMPKNGVVGEIQVSPDGTSQPVYREIKGNEKIGNYTVDDYAKVVDKNVHKFMPRFLMFSKTNRRISWNWAAFFFGPFWLAYRKMGKWAAVAMLLIMFIPLVFFNEVTEYYQTTGEQYSEILTSSAFSTTEEMNAALEDFEANLPTQPACLTAASYVEMAVDILCALYGNYLYFVSCTKTLDKASKISNEKKKEKYLKKRTGRSVASVIVFIIKVYIVAIVVGVAMYYLGTDLATLLRRFIK